MNDKRLGLFVERTDRRFAVADFGTVYGSVEFAGPENADQKIFNSWKMQNLENDGPRARCMPTWSPLNTAGSSTAAHIEAGA